MIPDKAVSHFSNPQRDLLFRAMDEAEARTAGYYCIPPFRWERMHYDLLTQADHGWEPLPESMLARVRRLQRINVRGPFDFYRIELHDRSILAAAERESLTDKMYPFFVYILTHEMVHMVRLSSLMDDAAASCNQTDAAEEHRVQAVARRILTEPRFQPVLERFCS